MDAGSPANFDHLVRWNPRKNETTAFGSECQKG
jgi:hypothetical protein